MVKTGDETGDSPVKPEINFTMEFFGWWGRLKIWHDTKNGGDGK